MGYNTRRKSLSLPSLGIHLPNSSRAHRPLLKTTSTSTGTSTSTRDDAPQSPPAKRQKRSHDAAAEPLSPVSAPRSKTGSPAIDLPPATQAPPRRAAEQTPPPSPRLGARVRKVDIEGINDDIVIAVIEQLEKTGNRPHLIKDLATILALTNASIAHSANPAALLSSRLSLYLKRPWTALAPCPLAKELIPVHPRKVFFFLTNRPRMPLPESSADILPPPLMTLAKHLTPSVSDQSQVDDDLDQRDRARFSPSPEVELFSPELERDDAMASPVPGEPFSARSSLNPDGTPDVRRRSNRPPSPPLEADERGFTETATAVRARGMSLRKPTGQTLVQVEAEADGVDAVDETPEQCQSRDRELGMELFGHAHAGLHALESKMFSSSPMIHPRPDHASTVTKAPLALQLDDLEMGDAAWSMMNPEHMDIEELDTLFVGF